MASITVKGLDELIEKNNKLTGNSDKIIKKCLYDGAGVFANGLKSAISGIQTDDNNSYSNTLKKGPTTLEKQGLLHSMGISPFRAKGTVLDVLIGFDGLSQMRSSAFPSGKPNSLIAKQVNSGTSWQVKQPFIRSARAQYKGPAQQKMKETFEKEIEKIMK